MIIEKFRKRAFHKGVIYWNSLNAELNAELNQSVFFLFVKSFKAHIVLNRTRWSLKSNDQHKHASKMHGFPFTPSTNTVGHLWMADRDSSHSKRKNVHFEANLCGSLYSTFKTSFQPCIL